MHLLDNEVFQPTIIWNLTENTWYFHYKQNTG